MSLLSLLSRLGKTGGRRVDNIVTTEYTVTTVQVVQDPQQTCGQYCHYCHYCHKCHYFPGWARPAAGVWTILSLLNILSLLSLLSLLSRLGKTGGRRVDNIGDFGTVAARQELREGLLCKDFSWWVSLIPGLLPLSFSCPYFALCTFFSLLLDDSVPLCSRPALKAAVPGAAGIYKTRCQTSSVR